MAEAERASIKYKQVEFLMTCIGETFYGIVNGVIPKRLFVEIEDNKCEASSRRMPYHTIVTYTRRTVRHWWAPAKDMSMPWASALLCGLFADLAKCVVDLVGWDAESSPGMLRIHIYSHGQVKKQVVSPDQ